MAASSATRKIFVDSVVEFLKKHDFDGLDMDWEYPASRGGKPEDKQHFVALLRVSHDKQYETVCIFKVSMPFIAVENIFIIKTSSKDHDDDNDDKLIKY